MTQALPPNFEDPPCSLQKEKFWTYLATLKEPENWFQVSFIFYEYIKKLRLVSGTHLTKYLSNWPNFNTLHFSRYNPAGNYMFRVNNRNTRTRCEIYRKLTIKTTKRHHRRRSGDIIVYFKHISSAFVVNFEKVNVSWETMFINYCLEKWWRHKF